MMDRFPTQTLEDTGRGGIVQQTILPSGLKIITETVPTVRSAAVGYWVATGSRDERITWIKGGSRQQMLEEIISSTISPR